MKNILLTINCLVLLIFSSETFSMNPEEKGLDIAKKIQQAAEGFKGEKSKMKMILIDAYGSKITRIMEGKTLEGTKGDEGDLGLMTFLNPLDVKGTKMLTHSYKNKDDDQWLYLPSLRRVKRISSRNKTSAFMGSEFSYEDLGSQEIEKYKHKFIKDDVLDGVKVWVLERIPVNESGYSRQLSYVDQAKNIVLKVEYFDRKNELLKVANFKDFKEYHVGGKTLRRASEIHMSNVQTKKQSIFSWDDRKLGVKLSKRNFKSKALKN